MRFALIALLSAACLSAADPATVLKSIEAHGSSYGELSQQIWSYAEVGFHEDKSSALLQRHLRDAGFTVSAGVADMPTAFAATYGQGKPVIGILAEFDALPGLSQDVTAERKPVHDGAPGHGCGHNLLGSGAALAAVAVKEYLASHQLQGTIRVYGTPAEEGGAGKVYMIRAGLFKDVDAVLTWHPGSGNAVGNGGALAIVSATIRFHGRASHAAVAPERGRSALDGIMLTGIAIEMLREHIPSNSRVHYVVTKGGAAPNIVPELAEMEIYARHPFQPVLDSVWARIIKCAQGAAIATETTQEVEILSASSSILPNDPLSRLMDKNLRLVGGVIYTPAERAFAEALAKTFPPGSAQRMGSEAEVQPIRQPDPNAPSASTDAGDVSWVVPAIGLGTATAPPGTPGHSWQNAASAGSSIGRKGMVNAAKVLALTAVDLFSQPELLVEVRADFDKQRAGREYRSLIPEGKKPPLTYRGN